MRINPVVCGLAALFSIASMTNAQSPVHKTVLDNGLTILVREDQWTRIPLR